MSSFFAFLFLISIIALIIGLIKPKAVIKWGKVKKRTRGKVLLYYGIPMFVFILACGATAPKTDNGAKAVTAAANEDSKSNDNTQSDADAKARTEAAAKARATDAKTKADAEAKVKADEDAKAKADNTKKLDPFAPQLKSDITTVAAAGGLGDSFNQVEKILGKPNRVNKEMKDGIGQYNYQDDLEVVMYIAGRVQSIAYQLDTKKKSMNEKDALEFAKRVMPTDATFVKKIDVDNMERIYVYHSKSLEGLFSDEWFTDADGNVHPGEFGIDLVHYGDIVDSFSAAIGGNK